MQLGFLGPKGTFSFEAAKNYSNESVLIEYNTITDEIIALNNGEVEEVVVPIENSIQGGVTETIDAIIEYNDIFVNSEIILKISHNLMANKKYNLNEIKEVYSHPQAIAQCRKYIAKNLNSPIINQVSSTAMAAKEMKEKDFCACIANKSCAEEYGLTILEENIQENDLNETKFWILSKKSKNTGNKMSLIFSCNHKPGALYQVLGIFNDNNINLTKIESRPAKTGFGEYIFLVDIEVNENINNMITQLQKECRYLKILGRYNEE